MKDDKRFLRLVDVADRGRTLAEFLTSVEVKRFFDDYEAECLDRIAECSVNDDDTRRDAGMKLQAMRALMNELRSAAESGLRAAKKIEELRNE